jgi:hypothetical protein
MRERGDWEIKVTDAEEMGIFGVWG